MADDVSIRMHFCSRATFAETFATAYTTGSLPYLVHRAKKGLFEKVYIVEALMVGTSRVFVYRDNLNATYREDELTNYTGAVLLVNAYEEFRDNKIAEKNRNCTVRSC